MNAVDIDEAREDRRSLGIPGCNPNSNIYIFSKNISSNEIFLFNPPEEYQLYFLLRGRVDLVYEQRKTHIPEEKLFFLSGKESLHFQSESECLLLIVCFREVADMVNISYFKNLPLTDENETDSVFSLFSIPEKVKQFALKMSDELSNERVYPTTLELLFSFLRAFFTPEEMANLFKELVIDMVYTKNENKSVGLTCQAMDSYT